MSERITTEYLEEGYEGLLNRANSAKKECDNAIILANNEFERNIKEITKKYRNNLIMLTSITIVLIVFITVLLGLFVFKSVGQYQKEELINGQNIACYVTDHGNCYHKSSCFYLHSKHQTSMYQAELSGYSPCSYCWDGPKAVYRTVTKSHYIYRYGLSFVISLLLLGALFFLIFRKKSEKHKGEILEEKEIFENAKKLIYKYSLNKFNNGNSNDTFLLIKIEMYSEVPSDVHYEDGLPISEDNRFIVYKSSSAKCYHNKPNCRGNKLYPIHSFTAVKNLSPCRYCGKKIDIPEWHKKYMRLYDVYKYFKDNAD